jgi:hypothetical protein
MRDIIRHGGIGQSLTRFRKQAFGLAHFTLIGLMRGARQAQQRLQMTQRSTTKLDMVAMGAHKRLIFHQRIKAEHRSTCDHESQFLSDNYVTGEADDRIKSADLYEHYKGWMSANGYRALGAAKFKARVLDLCPLSTSKRMLIGLDVTYGIDFLNQKTGWDVND